MGPFPELIDPHRTWALWMQLPLLFCVVAVTARQVREGFRSSDVDVPVVVAALLAVTGVFLFAPWESVPWSGHEEHYRELLLGGPAEEGSLESTNAFPFASGIAWAMGNVLPGPIADALWRLGNRLALAAALLAMAACAGLLSDSRRSTAALLLVPLACASVPLLGWSTTGYAVVPAMAMAGLALLLALRGDGAGALAWAGLAVATRMEWAALLVGVLLISIAKGALRRRDPRWLMTGLVLGAEGLFTLSKHGGLPGRPSPSIALENLGNVPLGGAWFGWGSLAIVLVIAVAAAPKALRGGLGAAMGVAVVASLVQLVTVVDLGARHLLPATLLIVPVVAAALASGGPRLRWVLGGLLAGALATGFVSDVRALHHRVTDAEQPGVLPHQARAADAAGAAPPRERLDPNCIVALPGGAMGAWDSFDVGNVHYARLEQRAGACVQWAVQTEVAFSGDTRLEFLDRAVRTLDLRAAGWLSIPGERWLLLQSGEVSPGGAPMTREPVPSPRGSATPSSRDSNPTEPPEPGPLATFQPRDPPEEALAALASVTEQGLVICALPPSTPSIGPLFEDSHRDGRELVATVDEPSGRVVLYPRAPDPMLVVEDPERWRAELQESKTPLGSLVWSGATPGSVGRCSWSPLEYVQISGLLVGDALSSGGSPLSIDGCGPGVGARQVLDDGTFSFQVAAQSSCVLEAGSSGFKNNGTTLAPLADLYGIEVHHMPRTDDAVSLMAQEMTARARLTDTDLAKFDAGDDPYSAALADSETTPPARALLEAWRQEQHEETRELLQHYQSTAERFRTYR